MSPKDYAKAVREVIHKNTPSEGDAYFENLLRVIRYRGHQKLLPAIVRELERMETGEETVEKLTLTLARETDREKYQDTVEKDREMLRVEISSLEIVIDDSLIGGYRLETKDMLVDRSHRSALVQMYRKMIV